MRAPVIIQWSSWINLKRGIYQAFQGARAEEYDSLGWGRGIRIKFDHPDKGQQLRVWLSRSEACSLIENMRNELSLHEEKVGEHPGQIEGDDGPFCYDHPRGCKKQGGVKR